MSEDQGKDLHKEFQEFFMISSLPAMRIGLIITIILFTSFALINTIFFPDSPERFYYNQFWIISPVMLMSIIVTYIKPAN